MSFDLAECCGNCKHLNAENLELTYYEKCDLYNEIVSVTQVCNEFEFYFESE